MMDTFELAKAFFEVGLIFVGDKRLPGRHRFICTEYWKQPVDMGFLFQRNKVSCPG